MYLCYVDETGLDGESPVVVTAGVIVDGTSKLVKTNREWVALLQDLLRSVEGGMTELKSSRLYRGIGKWKHIEGNARHTRMEELIDWFVGRSHAIALAAVDLEVNDGRVELEGLSGPELTCAFHIVLQVQRAHQGKGKNKGVTLLVMDESKVSGRLADLLERPPKWSEAYYGRKTRDDPLHQLVHTPFYVKSDRIELIQLADLIAFVYRRYVEICRFGEAYDGEGDRIRRWKGKLDERLLGQSHRWPKRTAAAVARSIVAAAPPELR